MKLEWKNSFSKENMFVRVLERNKPIGTQRKLEDRQLAEFFFF